MTEKHDNAAAPSWRKSMKAYAQACGIGRTMLYKNPPLSVYIGRRRIPYEAPDDYLRRVGRPAQEAA